MTSLKKVVTRFLNSCCDDIKQKILFNWKILKDTKKIIYSFVNATLHAVNFNDYFIFAYLSP